MVRFDTPAPPARSVDAPHDGPNDVAAQAQQASQRMLEVVYDPNERKNEVQESSSDKEKRFNDGFRLAEMVFGHASPEVLSLEIRRAQELIRLNRLEEAKANLQHAAEGHGLNGKPKDAFEMHGLLLAMSTVEEKLGNSAKAKELKRLSDEYTSIIVSRFGINDALSRQPNDEKLSPELARYATSLSALGDKEGAERVFTAAIKFLEYHHGPNSPHLLEVLPAYREFLSESKSDTHALDERIKRLRDSVPTSEPKKAPEEHGASNREVDQGDSASGDSDSKSRFDINKLLEALDPVAKDPAEGKEREYLLVRNLTIASTIFGANSEEFANLCIAVGNQITHNDGGDISRARKYFEGAIRILDVPGSDRVRLSMALEDFAKALEIDAPEKSHLLSKRADEVKTEHNLMRSVQLMAEAQPQSPETAQALEALADFYSTHEQLGKANKLRMEASAIRNMSR